jgi:serine protease Do
MGDASGMPAMRLSESRLARILAVLFALSVIPALVSLVEAAAKDHLWTELPGKAEPSRAQSLPDFSGLASRLSPAVVNIATEQAGKEPAATSGGEGAPDAPSPLDPFEQFSPHARSLGSGFIISKDGYILTNQHVVAHAETVTVSTRDGDQYSAKVIGVDEKSDIALIKIDPRHPLPVAPLGDSDRVKVGQWVMAIGNPFGFDHSVTVGVVSAKGRFIPGNYDDFIQTDASINPGNSGGPLIDVRGEVVGVNSAIYTRTGANMGIGFAIPINIVKHELEQLRNSGKVVRGWLGVYIQEVTPDLAKSMGLPGPRGALVADVLKDGPAKAAGIERGDVIVGFQGRPITDSRELPLLVGRTPIGTVATVKLLRGGKTREVKVTIKESHEEKLAMSERWPGGPRVGAPPFGLTVRDLSPMLAKELGLSEHGGVVIASVEPGSRAEQAGLRAHDVILEINRKAVPDVKSYQHALKAGGTGKVVLLLIRRGRNSVYVALAPRT